MELGDKLKDLNLSADEMDKFTKAFKDKKFREMLCDYAQEISDPENRRIYEEEIKLLEQDRGNSVEFIHPTPFRVIKTSEGGKQKCFINICSNEKIGKPEVKCAVSEDGRKGQNWSLPHTLHPGRQHEDPKGNKFMIYDVIYHPDTLHLASRNKRFMDMVDDTAIQGIQRAFKVTLDKRNVKEMKTKYKGTPQPCVIRKPIAGYQKPHEQPGPLSFPYPDEKQLEGKPAETLPKKTGDAQLNFQTRQQQTKEPTQPNYTVKYRSVVDLQDFRCSRDSAQSPRPKEIVVTIDVPLLKSVTNTNLEVKQKSLLLESEKPAYRLELPLAYPVDEDKGEAKFSKQKGQLTVTLPVLPPAEAFDYSVGSTTPTSDFQSDSESQGESGVAEEEDKGDEREWRGRQEQEAEQIDRKTGEELRDKEETGTQEERKTQPEREGQESEEEERKDRILQREEQKTEDLPEQQELNREVFQSITTSDAMNPHDELQEDGCDRSAENLECGDTSLLRAETSAEEENSTADKRLQAPAKDEDRHILIYDVHSGHQAEDKEENLTSALDLAAETNHSDNQEETEKTEAGRGGKQVGTGAAHLNDASGEEPRSVSDMKLILRSAEFPSASEEQREETDEDDLPAGTSFPPAEWAEPQPALLREVDADGNERVISDHSTTAAFDFQNQLLYELD
ncbi:protein kintoun-like [Menidia menidia]